MPDDTRTLDPENTEEMVQEADEESFPASDAPAFTPVMRIRIREEPPQEESE
jgi:hypothetical protein